MESGSEPWGFGFLVMGAMGLPLMTTKQSALGWGDRNPARAIGRDRIKWRYGMTGFSFWVCFSSSILAGSLYLVDGLAFTWQGSVICGLVALYGDIRTFHQFHSRTNTKLAVHRTCLWVYWTRDICY